MIPRRLVRTVPTETSPQVEDWWAKACRLHQDWDHVTFRDPIDPDLFPLTSPQWDQCTSGAQLAGLIRTEALWRWGGIYIDSDVELWRPMDPLTPLDGFVGYEDEDVIPDAVMGFTAGHPALKKCIDMALIRLRSMSADWRTGAGAWSTGPGVTTTVLKDRSDVLCLPPGSFYPYHYSVKGSVDIAAIRAVNPWAFGAHHWSASWM